jgi:hypothetical protein
MAAAVCAFPTRSRRDRHRDPDHPARHPGRAHRTARRCDRSRRQPPQQAPRCPKRRPSSSNSTAPEAGVKEQAETRAGHRRRERRRISNGPPARKTAAACGRPGHDASLRLPAAAPGCRAWATDVCVPISRLAECIARNPRRTWHRRKLLIARSLVGHVGDGNFHLAAMNCAASIPTGYQALVRLLMLQRTRPGRRAEHRRLCLGLPRLAAGRARPGPVEGQAHPGKATRHRFQPGVNEDLAATARVGHAAGALSPRPAFDGVFGMWYGKGPGVDRCGDVFRHANAAGTSQARRRAGDRRRRPRARSSTVAHQTEHLLQGGDDAGAGARPACRTTSTRPARLGHVRYSGCWVALQGAWPTP